MAQQYKVKRDVFTSTKPTYYKVNDHQDLLDVFKDGLLTHEELRGFFRACIIKYLYRFDKKNQAQSDLNKMVYYATKLRDLELGDQKGF